MKKNYQVLSKRNSSNNKDKTKFIRSNSTQNLDSKIRNKVNEKTRINSPSNGSMISSSNDIKVDDVQSKMKISDLNKNNMKNEESLTLNNEISNLKENSTDNPKLKQIIAYNEFLKDENFNLRMTLEKQKINSLEERIVSSNINSGEYDKLKDKVTSLLRENNDLKTKTQEKIGIFLNFCKKYITKFKELIYLLMKHENSSQCKSESKDLILKEISGACESFNRSIINGKLSENILLNTKKENSKDNLIEIFEENLSSSNIQYVEVVSKLEKQITSLKAENENLSKQIYRKEDKTLNTVYNSEEKKNKENNSSRIIEQENIKLKNTISALEIEIEKYKDNISKLQLELSSKNTLIEHLDNILKTSLNNNNLNTSKRRNEESTTNFTYSISKCNNELNSNTLVLSNNNLLSPIRKSKDDEKNEVQLSDLGKVIKNDIELSFAEKYLKENDTTQANKLQISSPSSSILQKSSFLKQEIDSLDIEIKQLQNKFQHMLKKKK